MPYIYDDGDNSPMNEEAWQHERNHGKKEEQLPFCDPPNGCWNCNSFDWTHEACTVNWNNMDESYYNPDIDDRKPDDHCECWELNPDAKWEDWHD